MRWDARPHSVEMLGILNAFPDDAYFSSAIKSPVANGYGALRLEAEVGIEPAFTDLQSGA